MESLLDVLYHDNTNNISSWEMVESVKYVLNSTYTKGIQIGHFELICVCYCYCFTNAKQLIQKKQSVKICEKFDQKCYYEVGLAVHLEGKHCDGDDMLEAVGFVSCTID